MKSLRTSYGWDDEWQAIWDEQGYAEKLQPARVIAHYGQHYKIVSSTAKNAQVTGKMFHEEAATDLPKVGDWVAIESHNTLDIIQAVLPRKTELVRKAAGNKMSRQIIAANVDRAFIVQSFDHDLNSRRIKRYLFQLRLAGITPVIILNKLDTNPDWETQRDTISQQFSDVDVIAISAEKRIGIDAIIEAIPSGQTAVLMGSSGVGKSTLVNALLEEERQATQSVREDDSKGRHTTTHREMFLLKHGGILIDSPGIREVQLWATEDDAAALDADIADIGEGCKFKNCTHIAEPGCAVLKAVEDGFLDEEDLEVYQKMRREVAFLNSRSDVKEKFRFEQSQKKLRSQYRTTAHTKRKQKMG